MPLIHALAVVISFGWTGVTLFFVLSGFLITGILWDHRLDPHRYRNFYGRRTLRIFPLYYGTLFIALIIAFLYGDFSHALRNWIVFFFYLQDYLPVAHPAARIMPYLPTGHLWSLAVEEQFYILWPFLVFRTKTLRGLFRLCACTFFLSALAKLAYGVLASQPFVHIDALECNAGALAIGGLLAVFYRTRSWRWVQAWSSPVLIVSALTYLLTVYGVSRFGAPDRWQLGAGLLLLSVFWGALLVKCIGTGFTRRIFEVPTLRFLGKISYGLYVYHVLLLYAVDRMTWAVAPHQGHVLHSFLIGLVTFFVSICASYLSFRFIESPILGLKRFFQPVTVEQEANVHTVATPADQPDTVSVG